MTDGWGRHNDRTGSYVKVHEIPNCLATLFGRRLTRRRWPFRDSPVQYLQSICVGSAAPHTVRTPVCSHLQRFLSGKGENPFHKPLEKHAVKERNLLLDQPDWWCQHGTTVFVFTLLALPEVQVQVGEELSDIGTILRVEHTCVETLVLTWTDSRTNGCTISGGGCGQNAQSHTLDSASTSDHMR